MNRGSVVRLAEMGLSLRASMRPRFMNRGSSDSSPDTGITPLASMRPRFMNRGSYTTEKRETQMTARFNEAPIHESGKWPPVRRRGAPC